MAIDARLRPRVAGFGAHHPLGSCSRQVAMSARARKLGPRSSGYLDKHGRSIGFCRVAAIPDDVRGSERLLALAVPALREAAIGLVREERVPLFLALAEPGRPDEDRRATADLVATLARESGVPIDVARSVTVTAGHAGGAIALEAACALLASGVAPAALVGGVDTYADPGVLAWLDQGCRLHSVDAENGLIPSEGAAFILLVTERPRGAIARVGSVETARERTIGSGEPNLGDAMTEVIARIARTSGGPLDWAIVDLNGERHRNKEWSKVAFRGSLANDVVEHRLAEDLGDLGAATGPMFFAVACALFRDGAAPSRRALVALHSEGPERGAFLIEAEDLADVATLADAERAEPVVRPIASDAADVLEETLIALGTLPWRQREQATVAISDAMEALARAAATPIDEPLHLERIDASVAALDRALAVVRGLGDAVLLSQADADLASIASTLRACRPRAIDQVAAWPARASARASASDAEHAFKVSIGVPSLHRLARDPLAPRMAVRDDDDEPEPDDEPDDEPEPDDPLALALPPSSAPHPHRVLARDCMEDIGLLGGLRSLKPEHTWTPELIRFEQRLLDSFDAAIALGLSHPAEPSASLGPAGGGGQPLPLPIDVLGEVERWASEGFTGDPTRAFARAFVLGCVDGDDRVRAAVLALKQSHPSTHPVQREALSLASSPAIGAAMTRLCLDGDPALTLLALEVLRARREVPMTEAALLLSHPDPRVAAGAAGALVAAPDRTAAIAVLEERLEAEPEDVVGVAIAEALAALGAPTGMRHARQRLHEERHRPGALGPSARKSAIRLLGVTGSEEDGALLIALLAQHRDDARDMGWLGHVALVDPLVAALAAERRRTWRSEGACELARALHRIAGFPQTDSSEPAVELQAEPAEGALVLDADVWAAWWATHRDGLNASRRHRFGRLYAPRATLDELQAADVPMAARDVAALELLIATEGLSRLDPHGWVTSQHAAAAELRELLDGFAWTPGEWPALRAHRLRR